MALVRGDGASASIWSLSGLFLLAKKRSFEKIRGKCRMHFSLRFSHPAKDLVIVFGERKIDSVSGNHFVPLFLIGNQIVPNWLPICKLSPHVITGATAFCDFGYGYVSSKQRVDKLLIEDG